MLCSADMQRGGSSNMMCPNSSPSSSGCSTSQRHMHPDLEMLSTKVFSIPFMYSNVAWLMLVFSVPHLFSLEFKPYAARNIQRGAWPHLIMIFTS